MLRQNDHLFPRNRADVSALIWRAPGSAVLTFLIDEQMCTQAFMQSAMDLYNSRMESDPLLQPYATLEEFIDDPGIRAKIAQVFNRTANGDFSSYEEAWQAITLHPSKPKRRTMREALEWQIQQRRSITRDVIE